ncbi:MAG: transcriptional regulator, partial [Pseudomonadota bacterium]
IREILELYDPNGGNRRQLEVSIEKGEKQLGKLHAERATLDASIEELGATIANMKQMLMST